MVTTHAMHGRDDVLALARARLDAARDGSGHLLLLTGEAGIGKTRLLQALQDLATDSGFDVWRAGAFPRDVELPASLLLDLGHTMSRSAQADVAARGRGMLDDIATAAGSGAAGDAHRHRRLLVLDAAGRLAALAGHGPALLALEDLHWCDELSLDVVAHLGRRLTALPLLVVGTLRTDEGPGGAPVRSWRARVVLQRTAEEVRLSRLEPEQTAALVAELLPDRQPTPGLVALLHERSGGVPLHVEELADAAARGRLDDSYVPETLAEAVRGRFVMLSSPAQQAAVAAAVVRRSVDVPLLRAVAGGDDDHAARCLDELVDHHLVQEEAPGWFGFRHALVRDAVELTAPIAVRRSLHAAVAEVARDRPELGGDAYRSAHHEAAGQLHEASLAAEAAAVRAGALSAHEEALDLLHRALRCRRDDDADREVRLLVRRAAEAAATDHNEQAARDYERARGLLLARADRAGAAALLPGLVAVRHLLGDDLATRIALLDRGLQDLGEAQDDDRSRAVRADLLGAEAAAYLVDDRLDDAAAAAELALAAVRGERTRLDVETTLGSVLVFSGRVDEGFARLEAAVERARELGWEAEAARGYRLLGSSASTLVEYDRADRWLDEGIRYAARTEQRNHGHYMAAHQAHVHWCRGRWADADRQVVDVLAESEGGITTRITALHTAGFLALGRGDGPRAAPLLQEARDAGQEMHELQRFAPAVWGLAECALLQGDPVTAVELTAEGLRACQAVGDAATLFPFLVTGVRARLAVRDPAAAAEWVERAGADVRRRGIPGTLPALDHAAGLLDLAAGRTGRARTRLGAAHAGWTARSRWWEAQWCAVDLARCALAGHRRTDAATLVAQVRSAAAAAQSEPLLAAVAALDARLDEHDVAQPWSPLTLRELEVARLVARGLTNRQIADALGVTVRTAGAHLEHIAAKLGTSGRSEVAAWVTALDLDHPPGGTASPGRARPGARV